METKKRTNTLKRDVENLEFDFNYILKKLNKEMNTKLTDILNKDNTQLEIEELFLKSRINRIKDFIKTYK
tara:strand:+ start:418 stop:627 length:210 start_codon:yes stop_codon:yes gene_type:complete